MENDNGESTSRDRTDAPRDHESALTRRALFGTLFGEVTVVAALKSISDRFDGGSDVSGPAGPASLAQSTDPATPEPDIATASPFASPIASVLVSPQPGTIGQLKVRRGETFSYENSSTESDTLTIMISGDDENLNFSPAAFRQDFQVTSSYLDPLVWNDNVTMEPRPWLAESWAWDDNARTITFRLRDDVRWHDGARLQAADVVFSFEVYRDDIDSGVRNLFTQMESAEALDSRTVQIKLLSPDGNWLLNAASQPVFQREQYVAHWTSRPTGQRTLSDFSWVSETPIGTGPWKVGQRRSVRIEFKRNDDYFGGPPHYREMHLAIGGSAEERIARWNAGESDIMPGLSVADLPAVQDSPATLYASSGASVMFAAFNFDNLNRAFPGLLKDLRVRRALSLAVNRQRYTETLFSGFTRGHAAGTVAQPWAYDESSVSPDQDIEAARTLLAEAGLTDLNNDGILEDYNGGPLVFTAIVREDSNPLLIQLLDGMIDDFKDLGVQLQVRVLNADDFYQSWTELRDYDFIAYSYALYPGFTDYDLYGSNFDIRINPQGWNPGGYNNEDVDSYIKRILITTDHKRQREMLVRLQTATNEDLFGLWFGFPDDLVLARNHIQGYTPNKYLTTWNTRLLWNEG